jgi:hypothetical protein
MTISFSSVTWRSINSLTITESSSALGTISIPWEAAFAITVFYIYSSVCDYGIAKTSSGNRLLHAMCTSLASHLLIRDTVIVSRKRLIIRIGFQVRERHIKLFPISSVGVADPWLASSVAPFPLQRVFRDGTPEFH